MVKTATNHNVDIPKRRHQNSVRMVQSKRRHTKTATAQTATGCGRNTCISSLRVLDSMTWFMYKKTKEMSTLSNWSQFA